MLVTLLPVLGYLCGSVSSAIIVCRVMGLPDPRDGGSGNPGATNVLRLGGKAAAIVTLLADVLKGVIPVLIARALTDATTPGLDWIIGLTGLAAFLGHLFPIFFGFKGGKGVATAMGVLLAWSPWLGLAVIIVWLLFAFASKFSSLGSLVSMGLAPILASFLTPGWGYLVSAFAMSGFIYVRHKDNIKRLRDRTESKISFSKTSSENKPPEK